MKQAEPLKRLPDAELDIMKALWAAGAPLTRPQLEEALFERGWASTTLLALLSRLEGKGFVARQKQGKGYLYAPAISRAEYLPVESRSALGRLFGGSPTGLVAAMAETKTLSQKDIDELAAFLAQLRQDQNEGDV